MKAVIIMPTYNEKHNIQPLIESIFNLYPDINVLIVDDNSPDGTGMIADKISSEYANVHAIHRKEKKGLGPAYIEGFKYAINDTDAELIFEMDADFSHDPRYIADFIKTAESCDLVIGSRYINGVNVINWPMNRLLLSYIANYYAKLLTGLKVKDLTSGFKCYRRRVLESIELDSIISSGYAFQIETVFLANLAGFSIREMPIVFTERNEGMSKMSKGIVFEAIILISRLLLLRLYYALVKRRKI